MRRFNEKDGEFLDAEDGWNYEREKRGLSGGFVHESCTTC